MSKTRDIYTGNGRARIDWAIQWGAWWLAVSFTVFLGYQLSRPLWDADKLIAEKQQTCEKSGMIMVKTEVKLGSNYSCELAPIAPKAKGKVNHE